jgi:hypothetical protein
VILAAAIAAFISFGHPISFGEAHAPAAPQERNAAQAQNAPQPIPVTEATNAPQESDAQQSISVAQGPEPPQPAPRPAQIDRNGVLILIRESLLALDQANKSGNYSVLRDLGAPAFQANTAARLAEIFAKQRNENVDLSGVAVIDPQLTLLPQIEASGLLHMSGFFPSVPTQVNFDLAYAAVNGQWRLFGISVALGRTEPVAPAPPPQAAAPPPRPAPAAKPVPAPRPAPKP